VTDSQPAYATLATQIGVSLDETALGRLDRLRDLLIEWNQRVNLTRISDPREIEIKLFLDALALVPLVQRLLAGRKDAGRLIDIGAGAGFPGLPIKIACPEIEVIEVDATGKKVAFIDAAIRELDLAGTRAIHGRSEDLAHEPGLRGRFDVVTARGVARMPALVELCMPFCRPGGRGLFPKGREAEAEAAEATNALRRLNCRLVGIERPALAELAGTAVVVVEQIAPVPKSYPRRAGLPAKNPL
jgi:16S rRNA (guanine527-N7)-methyltransferase